MVINFKIHKISRVMYKFVRTSIIIIKICIYRFKEGKKTEREELKISSFPFLYKKKYIFTIVFPQI
jgi:hypothetical protein